MKAAGARFGQCLDLFRQPQQRVAPVIGEQFHPGHIRREENPAIRLAFAAVDRCRQRSAEHQPGHEGRGQPPARAAAGHQPVRP